jgi:hypothetical protein
MNWIFEVYGNTYKALTLQGREKPSAEPKDREQAPPMPILHPIGFLMGATEPVRARLQRLPLPPSSSDRQDPLRSIT